MTWLFRRTSAFPSSLGQVSAAPRRLLIIFNPAAGRRPKRRLRRIVDALEKLGCPVTLRSTAARGDAVAIARAASSDEFDLVVAAGGDGTINEVANGLAHSALPLGVIPIGTGNVVANEIALPRGPHALARLLAFGAARPVWSGEIDGRRFLQMAGAGFDAAVLQRLDDRLKQRLGKLAFATAICSALLHHRPGRYRVECAGVSYEAASIVVAKGHFYAGRFVLAPDARLDEAQLHLVLFMRGTRRDVMRYLLAMALGFVHRLPDVLILAAQSCRIVGPAGAPIEADGDIVATAPASITIASRPICVVRPD